METLWLSLKVYPLLLFLPIYDNADKLTNSYVIASSLVGNKTTNYDPVLFGDFSKSETESIGGLDILFDPYTLSVQGIGRWSLLLYWMVTLFKMLTLSFKSRPKHNLFNW